MRPPRTRLRLILIAAAFVVAGFAFAFPSAARPGPSDTPPNDTPNVTDYFSADEISRARRYTGPRYLLGFASLGVGLAAGALLALGGPARTLGAWASRVTGERWPLTAMLLGAIITLVPLVLTVPFAVARGFIHERRFGLSTQSLGSFLSDMAKGAGVQVVITAIVALAFFFIARKMPSAWPPVAAAVMVALTVLMVVVYPLIYEPLFNKFTPVDSATRDRIVALARDAGVRVDRVLVADASRRTTKQNAYVSGLGATKRVVLYDTLLQASSTDEIDLIVAHELGHVVHRDVLKGTILGSVGAVGAVALIWLLVSRAGVLRFAGASGPGDPRLLPLLALVLSVASIVTLPAVNGFSRRIEASADRFAVRVTGDAATAVRVEVNLARSNVSDLQPNPFIEWMFFTHPATMERIRIALDEGAT